MGEQFILQLNLFNNHNDNGNEVTYCCSFGISELYCVFLTRNQSDNFVSCNISSFPPRSIVLLEKLTVSQLVKKFLPFYATRRFNTAFASARRLSLSSDNSMQSMPDIPLPIAPAEYYTPIYAWVFQEVSFFRSGFPNNTLYMPLLSTICAT